MDRFLLNTRKVWKISYCPRMTVLGRSVVLIVKIVRMRFIGMKMCSSRAITKRLPRKIWKLDYFSRHFLRNWRDAYIQVLRVELTFDAQGFRFHYKGLTGGGDRSDGCFKSMSTAILQLARAQFDSAKLATNCEKITTEKDVLGRVSNTVHWKRMSGCACWLLAVQWREQCEMYYFSCPII